MTYKYRAYTPDKKIVQGKLEAESEIMAEAALYAAGYQRVLSLSEVPPGPSLMALIPSLFGIKTGDVIEFSQQLATLLDSGLPILRALRLLEGQTSKAMMRRVIASLAEAIENGSSFSQALGRQPQAFSETFAQVVQASEQAGKLEDGLRQMADYMEKSSAAQQKIKRAMVYPVVVLVLAVGVVALLVTMALPPLVELFTSLGAELPATTKFLLAAAGFVIDYKLHLLGLLLALIAGVWVYFRMPSGRLQRDRLLLKMPLTGVISLQRNMQQFCRLTSMLLRAGLRLPQIIALVGRTLGNRIVRQALTEVVDKMVQGRGLSRPMSENPVFPPLLVEMVVTGEQTGTLEDSLATMADYYDKRIERRISVLISLLEPLVTLFVGLVVIFIALSMITPLYSILKSM